MSSVDSLSYSSEVSSDSTSSIDSLDVSPKTKAKKSRNKRNKGKGKWRKKNDFRYLATDTTTKLLSKKEFQSCFEKAVDLLDYDGLISEIKAENEALVAFLSSSATVQVLLCLVIETIDFPQDMEIDAEKFRYKFPALISEVLSLECLSLSVSGALNDDTLHLFFSFLRKPDVNLDPVKVHYFAKIATTFSQIYEETILDFVQRNPWILDCLLNKIHYYPLANLLLQLHLPPPPPPPSSSYTEGCDSSTEGAQEMTFHCCYVNDYFTLHKLSEKFLPHSFSHLSESERQEAIRNAAFVFLGLTLRTIPFREYIAIPPELDIFCEISLIGTLLSCGLEEANNNLECLNDSWHAPILVHGLTIVYEILGSLVLGSKNDRWNADYHYSTLLLLQFVQQGMWDCSKDTERLILEVESEMLPKFGQLASFLTMNDDREKNKKLKQKPRLGGLRLKIAEFFMICLVTCSKDAMVEIFNLQVPQKLLSLFVECDMCNILQHQVALVLSFVLQKTEADLNFCQKLWIVECQLFPWFVDAWELNFVSEQQHHRRKGYMGHLIPLGNTLATLLDDYDHELYDIIDDDVLASFERIRNHDLQIENEIQEREIGGSHPVYSNEERKCTKLQVDTLGVDFDQLMGGIMSSDAATIHMFSEYLYEDEEDQVGEEDMEEEEQVQHKDPVQAGNHKETMNSSNGVEQKTFKPKSPEESLSSRFAQMLAMNASDIVPVSSNRKLSLEKNNKPNRESFEKLVKNERKEKEKDIFEDDSFLWSCDDEEATTAAKEGLMEEELAPQQKIAMFAQSTGNKKESARKVGKSKNFVKSRTFLSTNNQLANNNPSSLQQPSVILRDDDGHAIGTLHSSNRSTTKQEQKNSSEISQGKVQSEDIKETTVRNNEKDDNSTKSDSKQSSCKNETTSKIPQLLHEDLAAKTYKTSLLSSASKPYRRKKEMEGGNAPLKDPPAWQKDSSDVFSTLVKNLMQTSFHRNNGQNNRSRKTN